MTLMADHVYEYRRNYAYKTTYKDFSGEFIASNTEITPQPYGLWLMFGIADAAATLGHHILYSATPTVRITIGATGGNIYAAALAEQLPAASTGDDALPAPGIYNGAEYFVELLSQIPSPGQDVSIDDLYFNVTSSDESNLAFYILKNKAVRIGCDTGDLAGIYRTLVGGGAPFLTVQYDDDLVDREFTYIGGPTAGYVNPRNPIDFSWTIGRAASETYRCLNETFLPVHETLYWRESGSENWTSIAVPDGASSYQLAENTWTPETTIEWYLSVTDDDGITTTSDVFSVSTTDEDSSATPEQPIDSIEIGNRPIMFSWTVTNPTGAEPTRIVVEWATSADAAEWTTLCDLSGAYYSYEAPANTFPGGSIYWRVKSYNTDGAAGPVSDPAVFTCVSAPSAPLNVTATSAPFSTIAWQSAVQTAYEISVDGKVVARKFGIGVYSYTLTEPLDDGEHTIGVRVQGPFGYWSDIATVRVITENQGTGTIELGGRFYIDGDLSWYSTNTDEGKVYRIYRDGKLIARTRSEYFTDRFVLGRHEYFILAELSGGNYIRSQAISGIMKSCTMRIAPAAGGDWIELRLTENSNGMQNFEWQRNVTMRHYAGSAYPVAEFSPYQNRTASYDCAFTTVEDAKAFEQLQGQVVILKSRGGEVAVGPLNPVSKTTNAFYITYRFSVQQIHWEDFIDDTVS